MGYRYSFTGTYTADPAVYKIIFGTKFYIWKGKNVKQSVETMSEDIDRFLRKGVKPDHSLVNVIRHITRARVISCRVEIICQTDNLAELIDCESHALLNSKENPDCLNVKFEPHIPKWISEAMGQPVSENEDKKPAAENKPITDTFVVPDVSVYQPGKDNTVRPAESLAERAKRIADTLDKIRSKKTD